MVCTEYQERINDLALAISAEPETAHDAALEAHLAQCAGCCEELERHRAVLSLIDSKVMAMVAEDPTPALAVLVRKQIAEETAAKQSFGRRWGWMIGVTAAAAAIAAILLSITLRNPARPPAQPPPTASTQSQSPVKAALPKTQTAATIIAPPNREPAPIISAPRKSTFAIHAPAPSQVNVAAVNEQAARSLEVLIPKNQRIALVQLVAAARRDQLDDRILFHEASAAPPEAIDLKPLKIELLEGSDSKDGGGSRKLK